MRSLQLNHKHFPLVLTAIFLTFGIIGMAHHEMWRDELQAWLIARDSHSLFDLIRNMRYEGHPALWHLLLYGITRFTHNPVAMQFLHLLIGTSCVFLVAAYSPFTRLQKVLISFGYFSLYEYLVISRNYGLGVLLVFLACCFYSQRFQRPFLFLIILGLLANTSFHGWIISVSWAIALTLEYRFSPQTYLKLNPKKRHLPNLYGLTVGAIFYLISVAGAFLLVLPPQDRHRGVGGLDLRPDVDHFLRAASAIWRAYVPIPEFQAHFWNTNFLIGRIGSDLNYWSNIIAVVIGLTILIAVVITLFRLSKTSFLIYSLGTGLLFCFTYAKFLGGLRHHGHFYILLLACVWIALVENQAAGKGKIVTQSMVVQSNGILQQTNAAPTLFKLLFTLLLAIHFFAALWPYYIDLRLPFTMNQTASQYLSEYIQTNSQENLIIAGYTIPSTSAFSARLNQPLYYPQIKDYGSFVIWKKDNVRELSDEAILSDVADAATQQQKNAILVSDKELRLRPFRQSSYKDKIKVSRLEAFTGSIVEQEHFFIYKIQLRKSR